MPTARIGSCGLSPARSRARRRLPALGGLAIAALLVHEVSAGAQAGAPPVPAADIPYSQYASAEAAGIWADLRKSPPPPGLSGDLMEQRRLVDQGMEAPLAEIRRRYSVTVASETLGGVRTDIVTPTAGVAPRNRNRILINLHGGAFVWGAGTGGLIEAIPIAATSRIKVISVDYRMSPEFGFPAASRDVAAVYRALLRTHDAKSIGLYGCSAGGILTAEAVAWFVTHDLPRPGAIVTLCGTGSDVGGDSAYLGWLLLGVNVVPPAGKPLGLSDLPYFFGADVHDPLVSPIESPALLAKFPPTLLLAGSRDFAVSSETVMQRRLWQAGVDAELVIFDGLWHAFMIHPELPESREVYEIVGRFFDRHLGVGAGAHAHGAP
jgi:epsilon-lactone hydrolase